MMDGAAEFFRRALELLPLYQTVEQALLSMEQTDGAVQRTQITFSAAGKVFAAVSLPIRRRKGWPERWGGRWIIRGSRYVWNPIQGVSPIMC